MAGSAQGRSKPQVIRGSSLEIPISAFEIELDGSGIEISRTPLDLAGAELCWVLIDCGGRQVAAKTSAAGGIEVLAPASDGQAVVRLLPEDLDLPAGEYQHEAWVTTPDGRRGALIEPSPFIIVPAEKLPSMEAAQPDGHPAPQGQAERSFSFAWPALASQASVTIPGLGMLRETYFVAYEFEGAPALAGMLAFTNKTAAGFDAVVLGGGALLPGTVINFYTRDQG